MEWRLILILVLMVVVVVFSLANAAPTDFSYLFGESRISLALIIIISTLIGAIAGVAASLSSQLRLRHELQEKDRILRELGRDNVELTDEVKGRRFTKRQRYKRDRE